MPDQATVAKLFELAMAAERTAEDLYRGLAARFAHHQEVAGFWGEYAAEEAGHAQWLERLRDSLSPEQLSAPADPPTLQDAYKMRQFSVENALQGIRNLEDAYQLVNELENSETNVVFEFLITNFSSDEQAQSFLRAQLREHVAKLAREFPTQYRGAVVRQSIEVLE